MTGNVTTGKVVFIALGTLVLAGLLMFIQLTFEGADVKTAIRLVENAPIGDKKLGDRIDEVIPRKKRVCTAQSMSRLYGHMHVECYNTDRDKHRLEWRVNVLDGMVQPTNQAARDLGNGITPWQDENADDSGRTKE